ncbi:hypothetical protein F5B22DRAFT_72172 [Xylaria bambusicola]|uniref:uncharacterized protein n=1 Tax=Xylaria bambusicola TaxID=326684 RepID=UPI0020076A1D|nr:uncharacterized protein F5B22DRAFT_72172 [Xylaria bambusicola]KAI0518571.1 hypothetical protein F5B22DRAFT_72172 [Xylaria bambusicola]
MQVDSSLLVSKWQRRMIISQRVRVVGLGLLPFIIAHVLTDTSSPPNADKNTMYTYILYLFLKEQCRNDSAYSVLENGSELASLPSPLSGWVFFGCAALVHPLGRFVGPLCLGSVRHSSRLSEREFSLAILTYWPRNLVPSVVQFVSFSWPYQLIIHRVCYWGLSSELDLHSAE